MLRDASGVFVTAEPEVAVETGNPDGEDDVMGEHREEHASTEGSEETEEERLRVTLAINEELTTRNQALSDLAEKLQEEVSRLNEKLRREMERVNETWRMSCVQVARLDELLAAKEVESDQLRARIQELEGSNRPETRLYPRLYLPQSPFWAHL